MTRDIAIRLLVLVCVAAAAASAGVRADDDRDDDHDQAREAVEHREALPLAAILERVRPALGGEIVGVNFRRAHHGRWIYRFKVARPGGQLRILDVDAASGTLLAGEAD